MAHSTIVSKIVYISGALTNLTEEERTKLQQFYEDLGSICSEFGFAPYVPHINNNTEQISNRGIKQTDRVCRLAVTQSYLIIAYVGVASTDIGIEIEMANHANKPIVLLYEKTKLQNRLISRLVLGNPAVTHQIVFDNEINGFTDAKNQLRNFLHKFCTNNAAEELPWPLSLVPQMVPEQS